MAGEPRSNEASTPHEKRRLGTERRLWAALARLVGGTPNHPSLRKRTYRLTVATLAREARVARNTIYANHRSILDELIRNDRQITTRNRPGPEQKIAELGVLIEHLQQQKRQFATENAALLKRAIDAEEILDRLQKQNAKLLHQLAAHQPIALSRR
jgi:hypothetical protein